MVAPIPRSLSSLTRSLRVKTLDPTAETLIEFFFLRGISDEKKPTAIRFCFVDLLGDYLDFSLVGMIYIGDDVIRKFFNETSNKLVDFIIIGMESDCLTDTFKNSFIELTIKSLKFINESGNWLGHHHFFFFKNRDLTLVIFH